jgi:hypothetical protein
MKIFLFMTSILFSSCSLISEIFPMDHLNANGITEHKDVITDEVRLTSDKIEEAFETKPIISIKGDQLFVVGAIRINPYILQSKNELTYRLKLFVTTQTGPVTSTLMFKCMGQEFITHKLTEPEREGINVINHTFEANKKRTLYYQEEIIETQIDVKVFNYLADCSSDIVMRAKNIKSSVDSSLPISNSDWMKVHDGMKALKQKVQGLSTH